MVAFTLNGAPVEADDAPDTPLLWVVRDTFGLKGAKFGCGAGLCGACTLHVDGVAERACVLPVGRVAGKTVLTIEGLGTLERLHPLQAAWRDLSVPQCGYCQPGQIMSAAALLARNPSPSEAEVGNGDVRQPLSLRLLSAHQGRDPRGRRRHRRIADVAPIADRRS